MNLNQKELIELVSYSFDGVFVLKKEGKSKRQLIPDEDGYLKFYQNGKKYKLKANRVAMLLVTGKDILPNEVVFHKNLNSSDYRLQNLTIIDRSTHIRIKEAHRNLAGNLRIQSHTTDAHSYVLCWSEGGSEKKKVVQDIIVARRLFVKLQLKYAKILNAYCVFD